MSTAKRNAERARKEAEAAYRAARAAGWRDAELTRTWQRLKGEAETLEREARRNG